MNQIQRRQSLCIIKSFFVYIKYKQEVINKEVCPLTFLEASRCIYKAGINFKNITNHGRNAWKITCDSIINANAATNNKELKRLGFFAFIPRFKLIRKGVIKGSYRCNGDRIITQEEDNKGIVINRIFRLKRKEATTGMWVDSQSLCIEFESQTLPQDIKLWGAVVPVSTFIPQVRRCFRCGCFGHISKSCSAVQRCLTCSDSHAIEKGIRCNKKKKCINCSGEHLTLDRACPKFLTSV
ncbi:hypothetical protein RF55_11933 [Lasius niger]|uniref:CCHC-type domain-containing protein n=1 Tax=Lasius niger TaxID=67767 RepID=A0A0J7KEC3_LASNI|nr:hypothetical protein RF55_11933 [Lasius niger]